LVANKVIDFEEKGKPTLLINKRSALVAVTDNFSELIPSLIACFCLLGT
jgi:hypothetical protein